MIGQGPTMTAVLSASGVAKSFRRRRVLTGTDLEAAAGEAVAIVGENGAGKTTLRRVCAGLVAPVVPTFHAVANSGARCRDLAGVEPAGPGATARTVGGGRRWTRMTTTVPSKGRADPWRILARSTGVCGLLGLLLVGAVVSSMSALGEPEFDGTREQAVAFFRNAGDSSWYHASQATFAVGMLAFLWFFVGVTALLRRAEGEPAWRSTAALLSGTLFVAFSTIADISWVAAAHRGSNTDPAVALFAFDVGNIGLATAWVSMAGFALATGWVLLDARILPRWCAWWAIATAVGLVLARYVWETGLWYLPYFAFWAGATALAVRLVRRGHLAVVPPDLPAATSERTQG